MNRRDMLKVAGTAIAGASILGTEVFANEPTPNSLGKKKALIIGAHPDDPELCCGGTMIRLKQAGWDVVSVYMTKGEAGIKGKTHEEAVAIRTKEATNACNVLGVRPVFMTQIDGNTEVSKERYAEMLNLVAAEIPIGLLILMPTIEYVLSLSIMLGEDLTIVLSYIMPKG